MNYRHAFHAGNFADVVKHIALIAILTHLRRKDAGFAVVDTHAGRGAYDLSGPEATRTGEAERGIRRLHNLEATGVLSTYLNLARGELYPGSPLIAAKMLRPQDRLIAVEKHAEEAAVLRQVLRPYPRASVETGDGYARLPSILPPLEKRGLVLMDPPYERDDEFRDAGAAFAAAFRRFAMGIYMIWFPIKSQSGAAAFCGEVLAAGPAKAVRLDIVRGKPAEDHLAAAGIVVINPPWRFVDDVREALEPVLPRLDAQFHIDVLASD